MAGSVVDFALRYAISADASKASAVIKDLDKQLGKLGGSNTLGNIAKDANSQWGSLGGVIGQAKNAIGSIPIPAAAAAGAVAGIGAAAIGTAKELFDLAKQGSDLGRSFGSFETATGLSASAVSTLAFEAKKSNKELSDLQKPLVMLNEMLYKAKGGSTDAAASLAKMGVTSYDLETALDQMAKGANDGAEGQERLHNITEILGKRSGPDFIKILTKMPDGFKAAQREAEKLGVTLSEDDVRAAKEFGKWMTTVGYQIEIGAARFALAYSPQITGAIENISNYLSTNQDKWRSWGTTVGNVLGGAIHAFAAVAEWLDSHPLVARAIIGSLPGGAALISLNDYGASLPSSGGGSRKSLPGGVASAHGNAGMTGADFVNPFGGDGNDHAGDRRKASAAIANKLPAFGSMSKLVISSGNPQWDAWFTEMGHKYGVDPNVLLLQAGGESSFRSTAVSGKGARGFSQFMPGTADRFNVDTSSVKDSIRGQAEYMSLLLSMFGGDYKKALAGYNAGEGNVQKYGGIPPFKETRNYVSSIEQKYKSRVRDKGGAFGTFDYEAQAEKLQKELEDERLGAEEYLRKELQKDEAAMNARLALRREEANQKEEIHRGELQRGEIDEREYIEKIDQLKIDMLQKERDEIGNQISSTENINKLHELDLQIETAKLKKENDILEVLKKQSEEHGHDKEFGGSGKRTQRDPKKGGGGWLSAIGHGIGGGSGPSIWEQHTDEMGRAVDVIKSKGDMIKDVYADVKGFAGEALGGMTMGLLQMGEAWAMGADISGRAAVQMLASTAFSIANQALMKGIFETAEGYAALATTWGVPNPASTDHFAAAGTYFTVAAIAGGAGIGLGLASRGGGGSKGGGSGSAGGSYGSSYSQPQKDNSPYTRYDNNAWASGRQSDPFQRKLYEALQTFNSKVDAAPPGHVFMKGMQANRGAVGQQVVSDIKSNGSLGTELRRASGSR